VGAGRCELLLVKLEQVRYRPSARQVFLVGGFNG
jgi:hypothetical protein